jgi:hypothetical protein
VRAPSKTSATYIQRLRTACAASVLLLVTTLPTVSADPEHLAPFEQRSAFHITAGSLASALLQFSRQTQIQVVTNAPVSEIAVNGVHGRLTAREALAALLEATGLVYTIVGNTVAIHAAAMTSESRPTPRHQTSERSSAAGAAGAHSDRSH